MIDGFIFLHTFTLFSDFKKKKTDGVKNTMLNFVLHMYLTIAEKKITTPNDIEITLMFLQMKFKKAKG